MSNETLRVIPQSKELPAILTQKLTPEQLQELKNAQAQAIVEASERRVDALKNALSDSTEKAITDQGISLESLLETVPVPSSTPATNPAPSEGSNSTETAAVTTAAAATAGVAAAAPKGFMEKVEEIFKNPIESLKKIFSDFGGWMKEMFEDFKTWITDKFKSAVFMETTKNEAYMKSVNYAIEIALIDKDANLFIQAGQNIKSFINTPFSFGSWYLTPFDIASGFEDAYKAGISDKITLAQVESVKDSNDPKNELGISSIDISNEDFREIIAFLNEKEYIDRLMKKAQANNNGQSIDKNTMTITNFIKLIGGQPITNSKA